MPRHTISAVNWTTPALVLTLMSLTNCGLLAPLRHGPECDDPDHGERKEGEGANAGNVLVAKLNERHGIISELPSNVIIVRKVD